jgi:hypothetical protein
MENGALVQVSVRVFWFSAVIIVQSIEDLWWTKRRSDKFSPRTPVVLCHCYSLHVRFMVVGESEVGQIFPCHGHSTSTPYPPPSA